MKDNFKSFDELKEELGDKFEEYMYHANIELLKKFEDSKEYVSYLRKNCKYRLNDGHLRKLEKILTKGEDLND